MKNVGALFYWWQNLSIIKGFSLSWCQASVCVLQNHHVLKYSSGPYNQFRVSSLSSVDIWGLIKSSLSGGEGCSAHCKIFTCIPLDAISTPWLWHPKMSPDMGRYPTGGKDNLSVCLFLSLPLSLSLSHTHIHTLRMTESVGWIKASDKWIKKLRCKIVFSYLLLVWS